MEDPLPHLRDLLGQICKRFPPTDPSLVAEERFVRVSCNCHLNGSRKVGVNGFLLLEAAEAALGSTEQRLELVVVDFLGDDLLAAVAVEKVVNNNSMFLVECIFLAFCLHLFWI